MITTTQVRAIIRANAAERYGIYTNKTAGDRSKDRRVKCYYRGNDKLVALLEQAAGKANVKVTKGNTGWYGNGPGITVKCVLG